MRKNWLLRQWLLLLLLFMCICLIFIPKKTQIERMGRYSIASIENSPFFAPPKMTELDIIARQSLSPIGYRNTYLESISDFTQEQLSYLQQQIYDIKTYIIHKTTKLKSLPWKFVKVDASIEKGWPHTHGDTIVLSDRFFSDYTNEIESKQTLIHEQIHVFQRMFPEESNHFITSVLGFERVTTRSQMLDMHLKKLRNNPDIKDVYALHGRYVPIQIYKSQKPTSIADSELFIFDIKLDREADVDGIKYFHTYVPDIITQKEHPYEIMAVLISLVFMRNFSNPCPLCTATQQWIEQNM